MNYYPFCGTWIAKCNYFFGVILFWINGESTAGEKAEAIAALIDEYCEQADWDDCRTFFIRGKRKVLSCHCILSALRTMKRDNSVRSEKWPET